jgi:SAM-dependent methyltransferase
LERDHRVLAQLLRPGLAVLDIGCGTGAITAGIARAVGPEGFVLGVDRDAGHIELAREEHGAQENLHFEDGDATSLDYRARFDIVTAARTLQWIADPLRALSAMRQSSKPNGLIVVLDFNHTKNQWEPRPPAEFQRFYRAFLDWRQANRWDNEIGDRLPDLFRAAGLADVESCIQDEVVEREDADFESRGALWADVIESVGPQIASAGFLTEDELRETRVSYAPWAKTDMIQQTLSMRAVVGKVPA